MEEHTDFLDLSDEYFNKFGPTQKAMAASLESLIVCGGLIEANRCKDILDAGSGLSSLYFHSHFDDVTTIDDNPYWADISRQFVGEKLDKDISISTIEMLEERKFDFVFYDYGGIETRIYNFKKALDLCSGLMYVDDLHIGYYREYVEAKTKGLKIKFIPTSVDEFGRYGAVISKK